MPEGLYNLIFPILTGPSSKFAGMVRLIASTTTFNLAS